MKTMTAVEQMYSLYSKVNEESANVIKGWDKHFLWLEDVVLFAIESRGKTVIPKTPAARKRKRKVSKENIDTSVEAVQNSATQEQASKKRKGNILTVETTAVLEQLGEGNQITEGQEIIVEELTKPTRQGRKRKIKEDYGETSNKEGGNIRAVTRKYSKAIERTREKASEERDISNQSEECEEVFPPKKLKIVEHKKLKEKQKTEEPEINHIIVKTPVPAPRQRPLRSTRRLEPSTPPSSPVVTKAVSAKKQKSPSAKVINETTQVTREDAPDCDNWPFRRTTRTVYSPAPKLVQKTHLGLMRQASNSSRDSLLRATAFEPKRDSVVKIVKHAWSATGKKMSVKAARIPYTPSASVDNRMKVLQLKNLSSAKTYGMRQTFLKSASPLVGSKVVYPSSESRYGNVVTGISSFLNNVQPAKPSKKEIEIVKQLDLEKRKEKEAETRRKKEEIMKLKTEEMKRKNEERMRRAQEVRENKEKLLKENRIAQQKERMQREEEKAREEQDRRRTEEKKLKAEKMRRKMQLAAKKEEEIARLIKLKEQEEREQHLEAMRKEEELKKLQETKILEEQKRLLEIQEKKLLEEQKMLLERLQAEEREKEKYEADKREEAKLREEKRLTKQNQQPSKPEIANATFTKDSSNAATSYEMTPVSKAQKDPNNYEIDDCRSDDSTDEDTAPKKEIPAWARGQQLRKTVFDQEYFAPDADRIFPNMLLPPNLDNIFYKKRSRFFVRTSSANWNTPPLMSST